MSSNTVEELVPLSQGRPMWQVLTTEGMRTLPEFTTIIGVLHISSEMEIPCMKCLSQSQIVHVYPERVVTYITLRLGSEHPCWDCFAFYFLE